MAKAIRSSSANIQIGFAKLGMHAGLRGSVEQQVHDGDTVITDPSGNISVRLLGIDTPEVSFQLPTKKHFPSVKGQEWTQFLTDPFAVAPPAFRIDLGPALVTHLQTKIGANAALNHAHHAEVAHRHLEQLVNDDMAVLGQDKDTFGFFMAFAHEVMDGFGRLLCFVNRDQETAAIPEPRPLSYNERLLEAGVTSPYFIWPNINPFRSQGTVIDAVPLAGDIQGVVNDPALSRARGFVQQARSNQVGIFDTANPLGPLALEPFELRFLARRGPPSRWVIDLSNSATTTLLAPTSYHTIPNSEDRLFVPVEYVPLFVERGWQRQP